MDMIADKLAQVRARIAAACADAKRDVRSITLLAVGKTQPADALRTACAAGARCFGENYVQEGLAKIAALADLRGAIEWHLIGPLQANKTRSVAEQFDWVHSIDRLRIAQRLSEQRPAQLAPLQVCLQVNIDAQTSKSGVDPAALPDLAHAVAALPRLRLRGLMAIPAPAPDIALRRAPHRALRELFERLRADGLELDTLSMSSTETRFTIT